MGTDGSSTPAPVRGGDPAAERVATAGSRGEGGAPGVLGELQLGQRAAPWTLRGLLAANKTVSALVAAACAVTIGVFVMTALGATAGAVSDATTCQGWSSANVDQQDAYARRYVSEHGPVNPRWGPAPTGVINAINAGCYQAFGEDVSDTATVVQAINRTF